MPTVRVVINGKTYRMACDEGQEAYLEELAKTFDGYVHELKGSFGDIGDQRLTVMAGVTVTDELLELKKQLANLEDEHRVLKETRMIQSREKKAGDDDLARGIANAAERIDALSKKLKA